MFSNYAASTLSSRPSLESINIYWASTMDPSLAAKMKMLYPQWGKTKMERPPMEEKNVYLSEGIYWRFSGGNIQETIRQDVQASTGLATICHLVWGSQSLGTTLLDWVGKIMRTPIPLNVLPFDIFSIFQGLKYCFGVKEIKFQRELI